MSLDLLSGLLLTLVAFAALVFLIKEVLGVRVSGHKKVKQHSSRVSASFLGGEAKPVNEHLIGSIGKVIEHSGDSTRPMTVRLGLEVWPARTESTEEAPAPVGTAVKVTSVDGAVLVVVASADLAE
jgi:membrane protein implicated in regulation of membrane protease activity